MYFLSHTLPHYAPTNEFLVAFHSALPPTDRAVFLALFFGFKNAPYTFFTCKHYHWCVVKHDRSATSPAHARMMPTAVALICGEIDAE